MTIGAGRALLRRERHEGEGALAVAVGAGIAGVALLAVAYWPELSAAMQRSSLQECLAVEAGRFPNNSEALLAFCQALVYR